MYSFSTINFAISTRPSEFGILSGLRSYPTHTTPPASLKGMWQNLGRGSGACQAQLGCDLPAELCSICTFLPTAEGNWLPAAKAKGAVV